MVKLENCKHKNQFLTVLMTFKYLFLRFFGLIESILKCGVR